MGTVSGNPYEQGFNPYSQNMSEQVPSYQLGSGGYQEVQKQAASGGVPVITSINSKQRRAIERQIISLYPDILNRHEAEKVKL